MAWQVFLWICKELLYQWPAWLISHSVGSSRTSPGSKGGECDDLWFRYYRVSPGSIWRKRSGVRRHTRQRLDMRALPSSFLLGLTFTDCRAVSLERKCQLWVWKGPSFTTKSLENTWDIIFTAVWHVRCLYLCGFDSLGPTPTSQNWSLF